MFKRAKWLHPVPFLTLACFGCSDSGTANGGSGGDAAAGSGATAGNATGATAGGGSGGSTRTSGGAGGDAGAAGSAGAAAGGAGGSSGSSGSSGSGGSAGSAGAQSQLADGQTLVLRGTGFGVKSPAAPILFDRFDGRVGDPILKPTIGPNWSHESGKVAYDTTRAFSGGSAGMADWTDDVTYGNDALIRGLNADRLYYSYRMYKEVYGGTSPDKWNFKHGALTSGDVDFYHGTVQYVSVELGTGDQRDQYTLGASAGSVNSTWWAADSVSSFPEDGWHRLEHYVLLSEPPGSATGKRYFKIDGNGNFTYSGAGGHYASPSGAFPHTEYDGDLLITRTTDHLLQNVLLPFYLRGGYSAKAWYDEAYIDSTQARVELGDNPDWYACTQRNPQPATAWDDTTISVTLNQGQQASGAAAYGFVVLADGQIIPLGNVGSWSSAE